MSEGRSPSDRYQGDPFEAFARRKGRGRKGDERKPSDVLRKDAAVQPALPLSKGEKEEQRAFRKDNSGGLLALSNFLGPRLSKLVTQTLTKGTVDSTDVERLVVAYGEARDKRDIPADYVRQGALQRMAKGTDGVFPKPQRKLAEVLSQLEKIAPQDICLVHEEMRGLLEGTFSHGNPNSKRFKKIKFESEGDKSTSSEGDQETMNFLKGSLSYFQREAAVLLKVIILNPTDGQEDKVGILVHEIQDVLGVLRKAQYELAVKQEAKKLKQKEAATSRPRRREAPPRINRRPQKRGRAANASSRPGGKSATATVERASRLAVKEGRSVEDISFDMALGSRSKRSEAQKAADERSLIRLGIEERKNKKQ